MSAAALQAGRQALATATEAVQRVTFSVGLVMPDSGAWRDAEAQTRAALGQFWNLKASDWNQSTPDEQIQWTLLDAEVHKTWARLEGQLKWTDEKANVDQHGQRETEALQKAEALYRQAGNLTAAARTAKAVATGAADTTAARRLAVDASYGAAFQERAGQLLSGSILGVPTWAWIAGGAGLVILLLTKD